jgi:NTP pyrophosphatase (non-canonical NTP hydrolase)
MDFDTRDFLMQVNPEAYYITDHYKNYPYVLVRLQHADLEDLKGHLLRTWRSTAPKKLIRELDNINNEFQSASRRRNELKEELTLKNLQEYIKKTDFNPEAKNHYFYKLIEEIGELSEVIRKNNRLEQNGTIKGTIEEEIYDVLYYVAALANVYDIDLQECFKLKEEINKVKWNK